MSSGGRLPRPELAKRASGTRVCSQSTPAPPPSPPPPARSLAAATPASPGSSAKLFNAAISRQGESSAPRASLQQRQRRCGKSRGRGPRRSARWDLRGLSRDAPPRSGSGRRLGAQRGLGEGHLHAPPTPKPSSHSSRVLLGPRRSEGADLPSPALHPPPPRCSQAVNRLLMS